MLDQLDVQLANALTGVGDAIDKECPPAQINNGARQCFVHRYVGDAVTLDAALVAERFGERLAKRDGDVFDRMMAVNLQVAGACHLKVEQAVTGEQVEHMIEKADARSDGGYAAPVQVN